ncbi:MAG: hypothetical protein EOP20_02110 [Hyphomicrobiales bacterium]|nr:MAG: hypothetical protein EOP20_02110 [Hyphomicrobiales bacterium]
MANREGVAVRFEDKLIPRNPDGTYRANLANVMVVDEDLGGGKWLALLHPLFFAAKLSGRGGRLERPDVSKLLRSRCGPH